MPAKLEGYFFLSLSNLLLLNEIELEQWLKRQCGDTFAGLDEQDFLAHVACPDEHTSFAGEDVAAKHEALVGV